MAEDEIQCRNWKEGRPSKRSFVQKVAVGLLSSFLLYQALLAAETLYNAIALRNRYEDMGFQTISSALIWLGNWGGATAFVWRRLKPSPREWTLPFLALTGYWFYQEMGRAYPTTSEEQRTVEVGIRMFYSCAVIAAAGSLRSVLGEGRQQKASLKRLINRVLPVFKESAGTPRAPLRRSAAQPETPQNTLFRSVKDAPETASEQILNAGQPIER